MLSLSSSLDVTHPDVPQTEPERAAAGVPGVKEKEGPQLPVHSPAARSASLPDISTRWAYAASQRQQQLQQEGGQEMGGPQPQQQGRGPAHEGNMQQQPPVQPPHAPHSQLPSHDYECSICHDIIFNPVVGSCGHDFCFSCLQKWQHISSSFRCPVCRQELPSNLGVCHRLKSVMEFFFPEQLDRRRREQDSRAEHDRRSSSSDSSSRGLCRHLSLIRAPNPVTFEAAVQEQQQQQRRRQQQQQELQQLTAELNTSFSPESSAQSLAHFLLGTGSDAQQSQPTNQPVEHTTHTAPLPLPSSFMEVQRAHWQGHPDTGAPDFVHEPHSLHSWLASHGSHTGQPLAQVQLPPAPSAASPPRDILRPRMCVDTSPSPPSSWHDGAGGGNAVGDAPDARGAPHSWGGRHARTLSEELTRARGHGRRWGSGGAAEAGGAASGAAASGAREPGHVDGSGLAEGGGGGAGVHHRHHASSHSVHWQDHRSSSGSQDDSECPVSTASTMLAARSSSLGGGRRSSACESDKGVWHLPAGSVASCLAAERSKRRSSACNSSNSTTLELGCSTGGGSAGGGSCSSQLEGANANSGLLASAGGGGGVASWCARANGAGGSQQPLLDAVEQRLRAVHGGVGGQGGLSGHLHSAQAHAHGLLSGQAGGVPTGGRSSVDTGGETSSVDSRRVSGCGELGDGLPSTPRAGGEQAAQAANAFFGCFSPRHSGGASPASSTCGGGRRAQSPAQGSYGPGSYPPSPKQPHSPVTGTSPTHSRVPTLSGSPSHTGPPSGGPLIPPGLRATPLANAHASSGLAAWGLWSPHSSLAHASAAHAHHPLAHGRLAEPSSSSTARDGNSLPTAAHVAPPFPLSSLVQPSKASQQPHTAAPTHHTHHHFPSTNQPPTSHPNHLSNHRPHLPRPSSAPQSPSRKLSFPDRLAEAAHSSATHAHMQAHAHGSGGLGARMCAGTGGLGAASVLSRVHANTNTGGGPSSAAVAPAVTPAGSAQQRASNAEGWGAVAQQHQQNNYNHHHQQQQPFDAARPPLPVRGAGGVRVGPLLALGRAKGRSGPLPSAREVGLGAPHAGEELAGSVQSQQPDPAEMR